MTALLIRWPHRPLVSRLKRSATTSGGVTSRLRPRPRGRPRQPARDIAAEYVVGRAEGALQRWLFIGYDIGVGEQPEHTAVGDETPVGEHQSLAEHKCNHRDVHGIAHVAVETRHHQLLGWCDRCRRAQSFEGKTCKRIDNARPPADTRIRPRRRVSCVLRNAGCNSQPVIHHGTSTAATTGAITKKTAEPKTACRFCIRYSPIGRPPHVGTLDRCPGRPASTPRGCRVFSQECHISAEPFATGSRFAIHRPSCETAASAYHGDCRCPALSVQRIWMAACGKNSSTVSMKSSRWRSMIRA